LAKIEITGKGHSIHDLDIKLDGRKIPGLKEVVLFLDQDSVNEAHIKIGVDEVDISADALITLGAIHEKKSN
jgi:hypothetical protein